MRKTEKHGEQLLVVKISARGVQRLRAGHVWVYRSDVEVESAGAGELVEVRDARGKSWGTALYSDASQIALRLVAAEVLGRAAFLELVKERIREAAAYRERVVGNTDAYRVVFSEADFLPGLIVDRYNDVLSLQALTQAMDRADVREAVLGVLREEFHPAGVVERVEARVRELEKLPARESQLLAGEKSRTIFTMNGVKFRFDGLQGQKTGAFLDQRENYAAAEAYARGEALDVFCYQGGFALHLARKCERVTGVDSSRPALEVAEENAALNGRELEWIEGNAFDLLKDYASAGRQYDTIVLDPPAFAKSKRDLEAALRGYKELNLRALKMLRPGGVLVTCSCSYHVGEGEFEAMVEAAALDAHRTVRVVEKRGQAKDHPVVAGVPESSYLKAIILIVV
jgi:23S rRNA (cytosine1962-C5)-methyltransferase